MNEPLVIISVCKPFSSALHRACPPLDSAQASAAYAAMVLDAEATALSAGADVWFACSGQPDAALLAMAAPETRVVGLSGDTVNDRELAAFAEGFAHGYRRIAVLSASAPDLPAGYLQTAFDRLEDDPPLVIAVPSQSGAVCMLALARPRPELLDGVPWGISKTAEGLEAAAETLRAPLCMLPRWQTVETMADLRDCLERGRAANLKSLAAHGILNVGP
ncbi:MAG TPA: DUF2064 domain-containing protein [Armatimonadota bacterium]|jgi:glycosyltransferase A (GT-A) superfamily protein (DUF2064 family)